MLKRLPGNAKIHSAKIQCHDRETGLLCLTVIGGWPRPLLARRRGSSAATPTSAIATIEIA
jgi:hypothetical protein